MDLDELLRRESHVPDLQPTVRGTIRDTVVNAALDDVRRRARLARARRLRPIILGAAAVAAGVTGVALMPHSSSSVGDQRSAGSPAVPQFRTAAQVIDAASIAVSGADPTAAPYWKVTYSNCADPARCEYTVWNGIDRPGVHIAGAPGDITYVPECPAALVVHGARMSWTAINRRPWSEHELMSVVSDNPRAVTFVFSRNGRTVATPPVNGVSGDTLTVHESPAPATAEHLFENAVQVLGYAPASARIKHQIWQGLRAIPGITLAGEQKDGLGRVGWRLTLPASAPGGTNESVLVDTATGAVLEQSSWTAKGPKNVSILVSAVPATTAPAASNTLSPSVCGGSQGQVGVSEAPLH